MLVRSYAELEVGAAIRYRRKPLVCRTNAIDVGCGALSEHVRAGVSNFIPRRDPSQDPGAALRTACMDMQCTPTCKSPVNDRRNLGELDAIDLIDLKGKEVDRVATE